VNGSVAVAGGLKSVEVRKLDLYGNRATELVIVRFAGLRKNLLDDDRAS
jgi:hypothetical protein